MGRTSFYVLWIITYDQKTEKLDFAPTQKPRDHFFLKTESSKHRSELFRLTYHTWQYRAPILRKDWRFEGFRQKVPKKYFLVLFFDFFFCDWIQLAKPNTIQITNFPGHVKVYKTKIFHLKVPLHTHRILFSQLIFD